MDAPHERARSDTVLALYPSTRKLGVRIDWNAIVFWIEFCQATPQLAIVPKYVLLCVLTQKVVGSGAHRRRDRGTTVV